MFFKGLKHCLVLHLVLLVAFSGYGQSSTRSRDIFNEVSLLLNQRIYEWSSDTMIINGEEYLAFEYQVPNEVVELRFYLKDSILSTYEQFHMVPSFNYELVDSLMYINNSHYRCRVRFRNLNNQYFPAFTFQLSSAMDSIADLGYELKLLPYNKTQVTYQLEEPELYVGEEVVFKLSSNNPDNFRADNLWQKSERYDYKVSSSAGEVFLHLLPTKLGTTDLDIQFRTKQPFWHDTLGLVYDYPTFETSFEVRNPRLRYLDMDTKEVQLIDPGYQSFEVILSGSRFLREKKTYRVEEKERKGSGLVAEIYTREYLDHDRILSEMRIFRLHRSSDGYLYIKDGDEPIYITNMNIIPKTEISKVSILRNGRNWTTNLTVNPGEEIDIRIEGESLLKSNISLNEKMFVSADTISNNNNILRGTVKIPYTFNKPTIPLLLDGRETEYALKIAEYKRPKSFDFIVLTVGDKKYDLDRVNKTILYDQVMQDLVINFDRSMIDIGKDIHGKQYLTIEMKITDKSGKLIDVKTLDDVVVCPGENSLRYDYYSKDNCTPGFISVNAMMKKKTFDLPDWAIISLSIQHKQDKYNEKGFKKEIEVHLQRYRSIDIELSFPAGLITLSNVKKTDDQGNTFEELDFGNLSGISLAMMVQASFYHPEKIARYRPYKVGVGFLAFNAFNFSDSNEDRDFGLVVLGSLYPTTKEKKFSFPLYVGGGYFLKEQKWFGVIGPGIRVTF